MEIGALDGWSFHGSNKIIGIFLATGNLLLAIDINVDKYNHNLHWVPYKIVEQLIISNPLDGFFGN